MALTQDEATWVQGVSAQTDIDPRVLIAWAQSEGHPGDTAFNYLNIQTPTAESVGVRPSGTLAANTAAFGSVQDGITAAVREIQSLGLSHESGKTPAATIADIAASPWASSHYGGPGGPNLRRVFASDFSAAGLTSKYEGPSMAGEITGTFAPKGAGSGTVLGVSGLDPIPPAKKVVKDAYAGLTAGEKFFKFVTSWRFAEVAGGFLLLLVGLYLLGRQFGVTPPTPKFVQTAADNAQARAQKPSSDPDLSIFQAPPGSGSEAHFQESRAYTGGPARAEDLSPGPRPVYTGRAKPRLEAADEIPF